MVGESARDLLLLNAKRYRIARGRNGERLVKVTPRASQPGDPGGIDYADWEVGGHDLHSKAEARGHLGREYGDGTAGRWGPLIAFGFVGSIAFGLAFRLILSIKLDDVVGDGFRRTLVRF